MKFERKFVAAGTNKDIDDLDIIKWSKKQPIERFNYAIYMHLVNHGFDPSSFRFERQFHSARKRK